ncbi:radical SAM protein [Acidaminobacter sp. JC074]|uniref:radical SAM protein n=1 Tax=Acidaminobacter sp. JC074 TaxID=2530199 RepID=UPI001F11041B|nr:radical SAM protein [Acidaminobacter sp. JC074]MCH4888352.1 radical SAM protein [Acidaminobacter sp. JC074]
MRYEGSVYRPPSEARSYILQVTIGCSHNKCTFCDMYKDKQFRVRDLNDIFEDLDMAKQSYGSLKRIFLADGNALVLSMDKLIILLDRINESFPELERISVYAAPKDILNKSLDDLKILKERKLTMAYLGIESGDDVILKDICKGVSKKEMIEAGQKIVASGIILSTMIISGLGGKERTREHALESAMVVNAINPHYLSLLTLMVNKEGAFYNRIIKGNLTLLQPQEVMVEAKLFIENLDLKSCTFRSNHASNYVALKGKLPEEKDLLLKTIDQILNDEEMFYSEGTRML